MTIIWVILFLSLIILIHEAGHFAAAKWSGVRVDEFGFGYPPKLWGKKVGETLYSINALPFGGFVRIHGETVAGAQTETEEKDRGFESKPVWKRSVIMLAGIAMNIALGWLLFSIVFMVGSPEHLMVGSVAPDSPAALGDIRPGDIIRQATFDSTTLTDPIMSDAMVALVQRAGDGMIQLQVVRGNNVRTLTLQGRMHPPEGQGSLGVSLSGTGFPAQGFWGGIWQGLLVTGESLWLVIVGMIAFFAKIFVTPSVVNTVSGPVGIFSLAAQAGATSFVSLLYLVGFISINIAVLNLLPFPALDGGRFLFLMIEKVKKSPVSYRTQSVVNTVGFVFLVGLMILVTVKDVGRLVSGG